MREFYSWVLEHIKIKKNSDRYCKLQIESKF